MDDISIPNTHATEQAALQFALLEEKRKAQADRISALEKSSEAALSRQWDVVKWVAGLLVALGLSAAGFQYFSFRAEIKDLAEFKKDLKEELLGKKTAFAKLELSTVDGRALEGAVLDGHVRYVPAANGMAAYFQVQTYFVVRNVGEGAAGLVSQKFYTNPWTSVQSDPFDGLKPSADEKDYKLEIASEYFLGGGQGIYSVFPPKAAITVGFFMTFPAATNRTSPPVGLYPIKFKAYHGNGLQATATFQIRLSQQLARAEQSS